MADIQFHGLGDQAAPSDWTVPQSLTFTLKAARAVFDGTAAAGAFLPAMVIESDGGLPVGTYVAGTAVAAGASADASFAPFLKGATSSAPSSGIQFDTDNVGDWFQLETTTDNPSNIPIGIELHAGGLAGGMLLHTDTQPLQVTGGGDLVHGGLELLCNGNHLTIIMDSPSASPLVIDTMQRQEIIIGASNSQSGNVNICGDPVFVANSLGFFQSGGVGQQPHPTTLADVINVLQAFGLTA